MVSPTLKPEVLLTLNDIAPDGTNESVIEAELPTVVAEPEPLMESSRCGEPVMFRLAPPDPEPLPRKTTPPALMCSVPETLYVPACNNTAPRNPLASGVRADTASMAD